MDGALQALQLNQALLVRRNRLMINRIFTTASTCSRSKLQLVLETKGNEGGSLVEKSSFSSTKQSLFLSFLVLVNWNLFLAFCFLSTISASLSGSAQMPRRSYLPSDQPLFRNLRGQGIKLDLMSDEGQADFCLKKMIVEENYWQEYWK
uniref:Uncharacterized protein n=1 Tax=Ditylenchus dipsaci TaxID=166011 RepID=A0A915CSF3_9BILA